ncbi:MAG TPA: hypothetical protein VFR38_14455 [Gaiellaceae bacterium]|nr:hypothetical protein [Gaiellaceae bacterium]
MIVRILIWGLFDSQTTVDELREALPQLEPPSEWIWDEASERLGVVAFGDELPEGVARARDLIGADPQIADEFDVLDL